MGGGWQSALVENAYYYLADVFRGCRTKNDKHSIRSRTVRHLLTIVVGPL